MNDVFMNKRTFFKIKIVIIWEKCLSALRRLVFVKFGPEMTWSINFGIEKLNFVVSYCNEYVF